MGNVREFACCCLYCLDGDFSNCKMKDYVDLPLEIRFKPTQRPSVAVTRSQTYSSVYKVGHFYAIQPGSRCQEVRVAKCLRAFCDNFEGLILEKCAGTVSDKVFF